MQLSIEATEMQQYRLQRSSNIGCRDAAILAAEMQYHWLQRSSSTGCRDAVIEKGKVLGVTLIWLKP